jgi:serine/threonine protein kinase
VRCIQINLIFGHLVLFLYQLLFNRYPYYADTPYTLIERIESYPLSFPQSNTSHECIDAYYDLLKRDVSKRINWIKLFDHKWLS